MDLKCLLSKMNKGIENLYFTKYGSSIKREQREIDDFFMIITFSEIMGIENPFSFYTLEMLIDLMPKFHEWHKRMGMEYSHFDSFPCMCCC